MMTVADKFEYWNVGSESYERLLAAKQALSESGLPSHLLELVFLRVSQINGCSFCISLHRAAARQAGATMDQIKNLANWRNHEAFGNLERAALAWAEAVTQLVDASEMALVKNQLMSMLTPQQIVDLTVAVGLMNALNRVAISFGRKTQSISG